MKQMQTLLCRSTGQYTAAVEQYEQAASIGSRNHDTAYKELDILVIHLLSTLGIADICLRMVFRSCWHRYHQSLCIEAMAASDHAEQSVHWTTVGDIAMQGHRQLCCSAETCSQVRGDVCITRASALRPCQPHADNSAASAAANAAMQQRMHLRRCARPRRSTCAGSRTSMQPRCWCLRCFTRIPNTRALCWSMSELSWTGDCMLMPCASSCGCSCTAMSGTLSGKLAASPCISSVLPKHAAPSC